MLRSGLSKPVYSCGRFSFLNLSIDSYLIVFLCIESCKAFSAIRFADSRFDKFGLKALYTAIAELHLELSENTLALENTLVGLMICEALAFAIYLLDEGVCTLFCGFFFTVLSSWISPLTAC